jgi:ABC-2 type transport system permease protein
LRLYWEVARRGFRRYATYRGATFGGVFTNTIFGFLRAYVFVALFAAAPHIAGYDLSAALTYTFLVQGLIMPLYLWGWTEISDTVQTGQIATDLYRPLDYQLYWLAQDVGRAAYHAVLRGIPPFVLAALVFHLRLPVHPYTWLAFVVSVFLAVVVSFGMRFLANLSAFWIIDVRGVNTLAAALWTSLSGFLIPIAFFPAMARTVIRALPFVAMVEFPIDVFLERVTGMALVRTLAVQAGWALVLLAVGRAVLRSASRKLVVQGG